MKPIERTDLYLYKYLSNPCYSPDGKAFAFVTSCCNKEENKYNSTIWINENGISKQLTGLNAERSFLWEDSETILFSAVRETIDKKRLEGKEQFTAYYRISIHGGEAVKAFEIPMQVSEIKRIKKDLYLVAGLVDINYPDYYKYSKEEREEIHKKQKEETDYEVLDEIPFWMNGDTFINKKRTGLFLFDSSSLQCTALTDPYFNLGSYLITETDIYFSGDTYTSRSNLFESIYRYQLSEHKIYTVDDTQTYMVYAMKQLGSRILMVANTAKKFGLNENAKLYLLDPTTNQISFLADFDGDLGSSVGSDCRFGGSTPIRTYEDKVYFITTVRNSSHLYSVDSNGTVLPVITKEGSLDGFDINEDTITFTALYGKSLQELYQYSRVTKEIRCISSFNKDVLNEKYIADFEKINFNGATTDIDGWVLKPINYDPSKTYPAILDIHGGPKTVYGEVFYHEMQYWAGLGYFVFFCNPEGSDGRGNEFSDIRGKYGTIDYDTIMTFVDTVINAYPQIDTGRIAVTGGSYGGFMTNWIIGHTNRFACAATQRSIANWLSFYGTSDIGSYFAKDQIDADLYDNAEKLWWHSPLKYAGNVSTPTLFIHSNEDYRCPVSEGMQLYTALVNRGVPARMCYFKGENHELSRSGKPLHRERRLKEITEWIQKYTKEE